MATVADATFTVYSEVNQFALDNGLEFSSTTDIESATNLMMDHRDRAILVLNKTEGYPFLELEYYLFISLSKQSDINSVIYIEYLAKFMKAFPRYKKLCVYKAEGLKQVPSEFIDTGRKLVVADIHQKVTSITQMKNNLSAVIFKLVGYIE